MSGETGLTVVGNLTGDPELRFTASGLAVANFTVASTPRRYDKATSTYVDGDSLFMRCSAWRELAENVANSLSRGTRVMVTGTLRQRSYETAEGDKRTVTELDVEDVAASLRWATVKVSRVGKTSDRTALVPALAG